MRPWVDYWIGYWVRIHMIYVVHTYYDGKTVHTNNYKNSQEAFLDYNSYTFTGLLNGTPHLCKKAIYIKDENLYFKYIGPIYFPPEK